MQQPHPISSARSAAVAAQARAGDNSRLMTTQLRRRVRVATALFCVAVLGASWGWIAPMARDMYGPMTGPSAWMMTTEWDSARLLLLWLMWAVMMAAMMIPSALPLLTFYDRALQRSAVRAHPTIHVAAMAAGYIAVWAVFSVGATALQRLLTRALVMDLMMEMTTGAAGLTLIVAGLYQFTPLKLTCLQNCRSPLSFIMQRWRRGLAGAFRMGAEHGAYCLGCCWALMLLLFAGGVMNLFVIVALTLLVLAEKLLPFERAASRVIGAALVIGGAALLVTA
jgi:predicted metal-binding membrane protein